MKERPLARDASGFWVASKFDDVRAILLDHARFSSSAMMAGPRRHDGPGIPSAHRRSAPPFGAPRLLAKAFTPPPWKRWPGHPTPGRRARRRHPRRRGGRTSSRRLTTPLPVAVISRMMGVAGDRAMKFQALVQRHHGHPGKPLRGRADRHAAGAARLFHPAGGRAPGGAAGTTSSALSPASARPARPSPTTRWSVSASC